MNIFFEWIFRILFWIDFELNHILAWFNKKIIFQNGSSRATCWWVRWLLWRAGCICKTPIYFIKFIFHIQNFHHTGISRADTVLIVFFARMTNEPQNAACQQKAALTTDNCQINRLATCNKGSPEIPCMKISGIIWSLEIGFAS